jgi:DNA-binding MarR family transcriptional regulator
MDKRIADLRRYLALVQISMNKAFGVDPGKKSEMSPVGGVIIYTCHNYRLQMKDLARMNNVSKSTVTQYVDALEKKGFVTRVRDERDRRNIYIEPTDKARAWIMETERKIAAYMEQGLSRLTSEEQVQLIDLLNRFVGDEHTTPYQKLVEQSLKNDFRG